MNNAAHKESPATDSNPEVDLEVAIIGAGFSGLGMAIHLSQGGETNFLVFEREEEIGGTWHTSRFPGAGCDIESNLYSFSYAQNKNWSRKFAKREEIHNYLYECAKKFNILPFVKCRHELLNASWDESAKRWNLETSQGNYTAKALVSGMGYLSEPKLPDIPGLDTFAGSTLHTAKWDESIDLNGKRVAIIGTGASTVQIVPAIQPIVKQVDVYQRSAGWVVPKPDKPITGFAAWALRHIPGYQQLARTIAFWISESHVWFMQNPKRMGIPQKEATQHLEKSVKDPVLLEKLRPKHVVGCKRFLFSDDYYPALQNPNVDLITDGIASVGPNGITTTDGVEHPADIIVLATGYQVTKSPFAQRINGVGGQALSDAWSGGQYAYLGTTVPGFPNLFLLMGPNSAIAHTSATLMSELQVKYAVKALQTMKDQGLNRVEIKPDVVEKYNDELQTIINKGIWNAGCSSWYIDENGKNTAVWPFSIPNYKKRTRHFDVSNYTTATP